MPALRILACQTNRFSPHADCCHRRGAEQTLKALRQAVSEAGLDERLCIEVGPCFGYCSVGPNLRIVGHDLLHGVTVADIPALIERLSTLTAGDDGPQQPQQIDYPPI